MRKILFAVAALCISSFISAQSIEEKIVASLDSFSFDRPQEKTYLQTDKATYLAGETIWFKAYATLGEKLTILSKVIYVDLLDGNGKVLQKQMHKLIDGTANGDMAIKQELPSGNYYVRCYTLWMLNFPSFITQKKISVINYADTKKAKPATPAAAVVNVIFYPEGGDLINGLKSIVAFKATDQYNNPIIIISGDIINSKNEKIAAVQTLQGGMGTFELTPVAGENYKAVVKYGAAQKTIVLPIVKDEGITLSIDNSNANKAFVKVERSEKNKATYNNLLVVAQLNYQVAYIGKLNIDEGLDAAAINKKNLPPGIMQVTVLTMDGKALAERLIFIANHTVNNELLQNGSVNTEKRKKNSLYVDVHDFTDLKAAISIINADGEPIKSSPSILSNFLLSADIKGNINDPGYYFKNKDPQTLQYLDLVMMVNGWRRFKLDELMANKLPPLQYPFETSLSISGKVLQSNGRSPLKAGKINLIIKAEDSTSIISEAKINEASVFVIDKIEYKKDANIYYQGNNTNNENALVSVKFNDAYFDTLKKAGLIYVENDPANEPLSLLCNNK